MPRIKNLLLRAGGGSKGLTQDKGVIESVKDTIAENPVMSGLTALATTAAAVLLLRGRGAKVAQNARAIVDTSLNKAANQGADELPVGKQLLALPESQNIALEATETAGKNIDKAAKKAEQQVAAATEEQIVVNMGGARRLTPNGLRTYDVEAVFTRKDLDEYRRIADIIENQSAPYPDWLASASNRELGPYMQIRVKYMQDIMHSMEKIAKYEGGQEYIDTVFECNKMLKKLINHPDRKSESWKQLHEQWKELKTKKDDLRKMLSEKNDDPDISLEGAIGQYQDYINDTLKEMHEKGIIPKTPATPTVSQVPANSPAAQETKTALKDNLKNTVNKGLDLFEAVVNMFKKA